MKKLPQPPKLATWLLHLFLREDFRADVTSDLLEQYDDQLARRSQWKANLNYWYQVAGYCRPFAYKAFKQNNINPLIMYQSHVKTTLRGMMKNKLHSVINIAGLSIGIAVSLTIGLWILDELTYDQHFSRYDRIGQVKQTLINNGETQMWTNLPFPLAEEIRQQYNADFEEVAMTSAPSEWLITNPHYKLFKNGLFAEPSFLKVFDVTMMEGDHQALKDISSVIVSKTFATTFFGDHTALGQMINIGGMDVKITGVYEDFPQNTFLSDIQFIGVWEKANLLFNWKGMPDPWRPNMFFIYTLLHPGADFEQASERIRDAKLKNVNELLAKKKPALFIHPMNRWHLHSEFKNGKEAGGRIQYVWLFGIVGVFVLLMACINFMNLSTARSEKRSKEIGIRKAIGSLRSQLLGQFFFESVMTALFAALIALLIVYLSLPAFNTIAVKNVALPLTHPLFWLSYFSFTLFIGLIAGSYPALYLSSIKAVVAIKGAFKAGAGTSLSRKIMVTIQYTISTVLIIGTLAVYIQIQYAKERPMGYSSNGLVTVGINSNDVYQHWDAIKDEIMKSGGVINMAKADASTTNYSSSSSGFSWSGKDPNFSIDFSNIGISDDYGSTIQWEILKGRDFSRDFPSDTLAVIINEAAADFIGFENPVGEIIQWHDTPLTIVGVVRDIITGSPYEKEKPNIYYMSGRGGGVVIARIDPHAVPSQVLARIEKVLKKWDPEMPFRYEFIDDVYHRKFGNEERIGQLSSIFAVLAIFISSLGIFGLSSFMAEQRTKEIGVRKILGASVFQLWKLMCHDFITLIAIACIIAIPTAYVVLGSWLQGFTYHTSLPWWAFALSALTTLGVMMITISWHTLRATWINPSQSLRSE